MHFDADDREDSLHTEGQWFTATTLVENTGVRSWLILAKMDGSETSRMRQVVEMDRRLKRQWLDEAEDDERSTMR